MSIEWAQFVGGFEQFACGAEFPVGHIMVIHSYKFRRLSTHILAWEVVGEAF